MDQICGCNPKRRDSVLSKIVTRNLTRKKEVCYLFQVPCNQ